MTALMQRRLLVASAIAVIVMAAILSGCGVGPSAAVARGTQKIPAGLAAAIHARIGAGAIGSSSAPRRWLGDPTTLGYSVALSADGTTALVGAPGVDLDKGAAYIFHVSDAGAWSSSETPTAALSHTTKKRESFGDWGALSADGTTAFVGAPDAGGGAIYVFHVSAEDTWTSSTTPTATLTVRHAWVGNSVAVSADGTTLVSGAPTYGGPGWVGGAYVFHVSSESAWASTSTPTAILTRAGANRQDDSLGWDVAISGDGTAALLSDPYRPHGGGAYVYHVPAEDAWVSSSKPAALLHDTHTTGYSELGSTVALSGDGTVALLGNDVNCPPHGTDVFHAAGEAAWASTGTPTATLTNAAWSRCDVFGDGVALSADGTTALLTGLVVVRRAPSGFHSVAYIYRASGEGAWVSTSAPMATLARPGDSGEALSADGATAIVGNPDVRWGTGAAHVYHVSGAASWVSISAPTAALTASKLFSCLVPSLEGLTVPAAKAALEVHSCRLGTVTRVQSKAKKGRVISQSRMEDMHLTVGTKVNVKIAK